MWHKNVGLVYTYVFDKIVEVCNFAFSNEHRNTFPYFYIITGFQKLYLNMQKTCKKYLGMHFGRNIINHMANKTRA